MMSQLESLKGQIEKTKIILAESQENLEKNPESYSARLLLMSTENYLADLLNQLDRLNDCA
jgi:hypothetical protein